MAKIVPYTSQSDPYGQTLTEPSNGQVAYMTIVVEESLDWQRIKDTEILDEPDLTIVELPAGGRGGGGISIDQVVSHLRPMANSIVLLIAAGFFAKLGSDLYDVLSRRVRKFLARQPLPNRIYIHDPETGLTLIIELPANISFEQTEPLNQLIREELLKMGGFGYVDAVFSPEGKTIIRMHSYEPETMADEPPAE